MALKRTDTINGSALHYARTATHPYGSRGVKMAFLMEASFMQQLEAAFKETFEHCPLGVPEVIATAGAFVNKPGSHGHGTAFDFDGAFWDDYSLMTTSFPMDFELYLGIESFLRRHFGIVLNYKYNRAHEDHWHIDNSVSVNFSTGSRSKVLYLQMTLAYIYDLEVVIDGLWGPQTRGAHKLIAEKLKIAPGINKASWLKYLEVTGKICFHLFDHSKSPIRLLDNVYQTINVQGGFGRQAVVEALNSFRLHPATGAWLESLGDDEDRLAKAIKAVVG